MIKNNGCSQALPLLHYSLNPGKREGSSTGNHSTRISDMTDGLLRREILATSREFKAFWKNQGPFRYALTSREFPPVLLDPEEWIFADDICLLVKALMQFDTRGMKVVSAPLSSGSSRVLRPDRLIPWKILRFPDEWRYFECDCFMPEGHLTEAIFRNIRIPEEGLTPAFVEQAFLGCLSACLDQLGYVLFEPGRKNGNTDLRDYLDEWQKDEKEAGTL